MPDVRVLIVADDPLVRGGLSSLLAGRAGVYVTGQASPEEDLSQASAIYAAEVLLWDLGSAPPLRLERLADVASGLPPVLALIAEAISAPFAWTAGVRGVLLRDAPPGRLSAALVGLAEGAVVLDAEVADALARRGPAVPQDVEALTPRELDVLRLLAEGLANKAIAVRLDVSENTVKFHVNGIFGKLGVQSRTEAVTRATRMGLVPL